MQFSSTTRYSSSILPDQTIPDKNPSNGLEDMELTAGRRYQFVIFKPLSYCFEETIGFDIKASLVSRPGSRLIR